MVLYLNNFNSVIFKVDLICDNNAYYMNSNDMLCALLLCCKPIKGALKKDHSQCSNKCACSEHLNELLNDTIILF